MLKLIILTLAILSDVAFAGNTCDVPEYRDLIKKTENRVIERGKFRIPIGLFRPNQKYGCALMAFEIKPDGTARDIKTIASWPTRIMAASAKSAIASYKFDISIGDDDMRGALIFEVMLEGD